MRGHASEHGVPTRAVFIGRPPIWGKPFAFGREASRDDATARFEADLRSRRVLSAQPHKCAGKCLIGKIRAVRCHRDLRVELAKSESS
ncbi:MAG: DUF4326 domain-containing protein [Sphingomonas sp.]